MDEITATGYSEVMLGIGLGAWAIVAFWVATRLSRRAAPIGPSIGDSTARRIARNATVPIVAQLVVRGIDLAVALALLRLLGPEGNGQYAIAVVAWLYVKTISDFGLSVLAAREIARDPELAGSVIGETTLMRWFVLALTGAPLALLTVAGIAAGTLSHSSAIAIGILYLSIIPASYSEAISSALAGLERMELAAWLSIVVNLVRAPLVIALAATRFDVVGVALAALLAAIYSALLFHRVSNRSICGERQWRIGGGRLRWYLSECWPLLVNGLLVSLFFRVDVFIVQAFQGDAALGVYDASYKLINLLTIVPAYAVLAVFPLMVRRASDATALREAQRRTTYILVALAWLAVVVTSALARPAIRLLAGDDYLPESASLLRMLIWFAPLSFANGVTQYVLIARGAQRRLLPAFVAAVIFNLFANLALVPTFGATAAATITVATEAVITASFWLATRQTDYPAMTRQVIVPLWRPTVAGGVSTLVALVLRDNPLTAILASLACVLALTWALRVIGPDELRLARAVLRAGSDTRSDPYVQHSGDES